LYKNRERKAATEKTNGMKGRGWGPKQQEDWGGIVYFYGVTESKGFTIPFHQEKRERVHQTRQAWERRNRKANNRISSSEGKSKIVPVFFNSEKSMASKPQELEQRQGRVHLSDLPKRLRKQPAGGAENKRTRLGHKLNMRKGNWQEENLGAPPLLKKLLSNQSP